MVSSSPQIGNRTLGRTAFKGPFSKGDFDIDGALSRTWTGDAAVVRFGNEEGSFVWKAERAILQWLIDEFGCEMESWAGTNLCYWKTSHSQQNVEFTFLKRESSSPGNGTWILRVDERVPRPFCASLAQLFGGLPDPVRTMPDGTMRTHFYSSDFNGELLDKAGKNQIVEHDPNFERVLTSELNQREAALIEDLKEKYPSFSGSWHHLLALEIATDPSKADHKVFRDSWNNRALLREKNKRLNLKGLNFSTVNISSVSLVDLDLRGCCFENVDLRDRDLSSNKLEKASFASADLEKSNLSNCNLRDANFEKANLSHCRLVGADLIRANFAGANLHLADLSRARASQCDFSDASMHATKINGCDFSASNFSGCRFFNNDFSRANVELAKFENANLTHVESEIHFDDCKIRGALISPRSKAPLMVLQRSYTGPWFIVTFLLAIFALSPFFLEAIFWAVVADAFLAAEQLSGTGPNPGSATDLAREFDTTYVGMIVLGLHEGYFQASLTALLIGYNVSRGYLTIRVNELRELTLLSGNTPKKTEYWRLHLIHRVNKFIAVAALLAFLFSWGRLLIKQVYVIT